MSRPPIWIAMIVALFIALILYPSLREENTTTTAGTTSTSHTKTFTTVTEAIGPHIIVGGVKISVEIADDPTERGRGLSGRTGLEEGWGMLFVFERAGRHSFWMYGMLFPIDIIWMDEDGVIVYVVEDAQPCTSVCETYAPNADAKYVLEVRAGLVRELGVGLGDVVAFIQPSQPSPAQ
ncbi:MAG: DUF192 domain-containing protein [Nitrososphaerota archaeon]